MMSFMTNQTTFRGRPPDHLHRILYAPGISLAFYSIIHRDVVVCSLWLVTNGLRVLLHSLFIIEKTRWPSVPVAYDLLNHFHFKSQRSSFSFKARVKDGFDNEGRLSYIDIYFIFKLTWPTTNSNFVPRRFKYNIQSGGDFPKWNCQTHHILG